jgi:hypothetical protein
MLEVSRPTQPAGCGAETGPIVSPTGDNRPVMAPQTGCGARSGGECVNPVQPEGSAPRADRPSAQALQAPLGSPSWASHFYAQRQIQEVS